MGEEETKVIPLTTPDKFVYFAPVKNKVIELNKEINAPFNLVLDKSTNIAVFAKTVYKPSASEKLLRLGVMFGGGRTAFLGTVIFSDSDGNIYRDVDIKGGGYLSPDNDNEKDTWIRSPDIYDEEHWGLLNEDEAVKDYLCSEDVYKLGIRTVRTLAIIQLKELIIDGKKISVQKLKSKELVLNDFTPVIEIRAFGSKYRVSDIEQDAQDENPNYLSWIEDAKHLISKETGKEIITDKDYIDWFAEALGRNVGLLHKANLIHHNLQSHNVTLDCRLLDYATLKKKESEYDTEYDLEGAKNILWGLIGAVRMEGDKKGLMKEMEKLFNSAYKKVLGKRI